MGRLGPRSFSRWLACCASVSLCVSTPGFAQPSTACQSTSSSASTTLCLGEAIGAGTRFAAEVAWVNPRSNGAGHVAGSGASVPLTRDSGFFWFFRPDNIELVAKVIDGRRVNGHHWYFHAPLTDVEFQVQLLDHRTGFRYRFRNPPFESRVVQEIRAFPETPLEGRVLTVIAHPDDEGLFAPLLGELCVERDQACRFLVLTRGENGVCELPTGCDDLAAIRSAEMAAAAQLFRAELTQWRLADRFGTPRIVRSRWEQEAGGRDALRQRLQGEIESFAPDVVLLFDPRHGSTCHPAHRASASLVTEAIEATSLEPEVLWMTTTLRRPPDGSVAFREPSEHGDGEGPHQLRDPDVLGFLGDWSWLERDLERHPSQFTETFRRTVTEAPEGQRVVHIVRARPAEDPRNDDRTYLLCD